MARKAKYPYTQKTVLKEWAVGYPCVLAWLQKLNGTKAYRALRLCYFCLWAKMTPDQLLDLKRNRDCLDAEHLVDRFAVESPFPKSTTWTCLIAVKSFFRKSYQQLESECGRFEYVVQNCHSFPSLTERLDVYRACFNQRDRALVCVVFTSGLALETLSKLRWNHFEKDWRTQDYPHISIPSELLKGHGVGKYRGVRQETFVTPLVKLELLKYRDWMTRHCGMIWQDDMNVFLRVNRKPGTAYEPLTWNGLACLILAISRRANVKFSIHDGRRIVETALESVSCPRNWVQKIKGRKVRGEDAPYSRPAVEQLRTKYREALGELEFLGAGTSRAEELPLTEDEWQDLRELLAAMRQGKVKITE